MVPFAAILLIPVIENLSWNSRASRFLTISFLTASALNIAIHARGATSTTANDEWNSTPVGIDQMPERALSWRDPQFLRGLLHSEPLISPSTALSFYVIKPCRVFDTRLPAAIFGGPTLTAGKERQIPIPAGSCGVPHGAGAYSLNLTAIPKGPLSWLNVWGTGEAMPVASVLNAMTEAITSNAAIVRAGNDGSISVLAASDTDLVIDINGYFARP